MVGFGTAPFGVSSFGGGSVPVAPSPPTAQIGAEWLLSSRGADGRLTGNLPIKQLSAVARHLGIGAGTATVPWSRSAYERLTEGAGIRLLRNGIQVGTGWLTSIEESWPDDTIKIGWVSEQVVLSDRLVIPDPTSPASGQATYGQWTRSGVTSTVMTALLAEQLGPTAHADWRVPGLTVGADPVAGEAVSAAIRYGSPNLLAELQTLSLGSDLGVRITATGPSLLAEVVAPVESADSARFSADLGNLTSYTFGRTAPTVTGAIVASEDTFSVPRSFQSTVTTDPISLAWGRKIWTYKDGSGSGVTGDSRLAVLAANEAAAGPAEVSLTCTLRDTPRLKFGTDWGLGHRVTVYVGRPGEPKTEVVDVVREVAFEYGTDGEKITPAIGSPAASALPTLPSRRTLDKIKARLAGLERSN